MRWVEWYATCDGSVWSVCPRALMCMWWCVGSACVHFWISNGTLFAALRHSQYAAYTYEYVILVYVYQSDTDDFLRHARHSGGSSVGFDAKARVLLVLCFKCDTNGSKICDDMIAPFSLVYLLVFLLLRLSIGVTVNIKCENPLGI